MKIRVGDKVRLDTEYMLKDVYSLDSLDFLHDLVGSNVYTISEINEESDLYDYETVVLEGYTVPIPLSYFKRVQ